MRKNSIALIVILLILTGSATFSQQAAATAPSSADQKKLEKIHAMYQSYKKHTFPATPDVTVEELLQWQKRDSVILVDVRSPKERRVSIIPNAISQKEFEK
ncbi:MAG TPA: rhodanese-like domain-containing protein, partial [Bacteroidetes bacterium]|nr:rhodanese-like domain-containing protein [Bacteroidota bacterium]